MDGESNMITRQHASSLRRGDVVHVGDCLKIVGPRGGVRRKITRLFVSGCFREFKRTLKWYLPIKYGLSKSYRLTNENCGQFHDERDCPVLFGKGA
jgi:hypothetical protein